jgi:exonuclease I
VRLSQPDDGEGVMTSFVFYDTETTGTDTAFDQILQFAAIRTDDNMRELDRFEIRCRLAHDAMDASRVFRIREKLARQRS